MKRFNVLLSILSVLFVAGCSSNESSSEILSSSSIESQSLRSSESSSSESSSQENSSEVTSSEEISSEQSSSTLDSSSSQSRKETVIVSFDTNGGPSYSSMTYTGTPITLPVPEYYHHEFLGWYLDSEFKGEPVDDATFDPYDDVTLYAKWDEVLYVYLYYGTSTDHKRLSVHEGDVVTIADHFEATSIVIEGVECPFIGWFDDYTDLAVGTSITVGKIDVILVAKYDTSKAPRARYITEIAPGVYETTSTKLAWNVADNHSSPEGYFETTITTIKGQSGGAGVINHASIASVDYAYEAGCYYISAVICPKNGALQLSYITGSWNIITTLALTALPAKYQRIYNAAVTEGDVINKIAVLSGTNSFSVYLEDELAYSMDDIQSSLGVDFSSYTGFGIRSSCKGAIFSNMISNLTPISINLDTQGLGENRTINFYGGSLPLIPTSLPNYAIGNWSFDQAGMDVFTNDKISRLTDGITLYGHKAMYSNSALNSLGNKKYIMEKDGACLIGTTSKSSYTIDMETSIKKKSGGGVGIIVGAEFYANNTFEANAKYIMCQVAETGGIQFATNDSSRSPVFAHIPNESITGSKSLSSMPQSFKDAFNAASDGDIIPVKITVQVTEGKKVTMYVDDQEMVSTVDESLVQSFTGNGYGIRANKAQCGREFKYTFRAGE